MSNLLQRVLIGIPIALLVIVVTWLGGRYFLVASFIFVLFLQREMYRLLTKSNMQPDQLFVYLFGLFVILMPVLSYRFEIGVILFLFFIASQVFKKREEYLQRLASTIFGGVYIPFGLFCLILLRQTGSPEAGFFLTIAFLLMIWGNDTFAYLGGKRWGRRLLAPDISPKKTWEGFFFGFLGAGLGLIIAAIILSVPSSYGVWLLPGVIIVSIFGPLGDLLESKLKRIANMKDSSTILPGHGGFFDRLDGLVLAAPAFYVYIRLLHIVGVTAF